MTLPPAIPHNLAQVHERLGRVPLERVRMQPPPGTATEADLFRPENRYCELVDGILLQKPAVGWREWFLTGEIIRILGTYVHAIRLGLVGAPDLMARMQPGNVRLPDVSFYAWSRWASWPPQGQILGMAPDLAVEVLSESNTADEMERKRIEYFASGCRLVWEFEPELRLVRVYTEATTFTTITIDGTLTGGSVLPGFTLRLRDLFDSLERPPQGTQP